MTLLLVSSYRLPPFLQREGDTLPTVREGTAPGQHGGTVAAAFAFLDQDSRGVRSRR
jgi:hypothetical protein